MHGFVWVDRDVIARFGKTRPATPVAGVALQQSHTRSNPEAK